MLPVVDVLIIGAGAAGLTAARDLKRIGGFGVRILEATSRYGGRLRKLNGFTFRWVDYVKNLNPRLQKRIEAMENERINLV